MTFPWDAVEVMTPAAFAVDINTAVKSSKTASKSCNQEQEGDDEENELVRLESVFDRALHVGIKKVSLPDVIVLCLHQENKAQEKSGDKASNVRPVVNTRKKADGDVNGCHDDNLEERTASVAVVGPIGDEL